MLEGNSGGAVAMIGLAGFTLLVVVRWSGPVVIVLDMLHRCFLLAF